MLAEMHKYISRVSIEEEGDTGVTVAVLFAEATRLTLVYLWKKVQLLDIVTCMYKDKGLYYRLKTQCIPSFPTLEFSKNLLMFV